MVGFENLVVDTRLDALEDQLLNALTAQRDCILKNSGAIKTLLR